MRVLFLGFLTSDEALSELLKLDSLMPVQTHRFGWSLVRALQSAGIAVDAIGFEPATDYPHCSRLHFERQAFVQERVHGVTLPFLNITGAKHLTRYVAARRGVKRELSYPATVNAVIVHGVHSPLLWTGLKVGAHLGVPVVTVLTDPPSIRTPQDNSPAVALKVIDRRLIGNALARMDGVVALAASLADDYAVGVPSLIMEGIATDPLSQPKPAEDYVPADVVYAGSLNAEYGVLDLLDAVEVSAGRWTLAIYGRGPLETVIRQRALHSDRIHFAGMVGARELQFAYGSAKLLANPRPPDTVVARYSFPSKLMEYMASGTPVVTTRLASIPEDYADYLFFSDHGSQGLAKSIDSILGNSPMALEEHGSAARDFILSSRGEQAQGVKLRCFLQDLSRC